VSVAFRRLASATAHTLRAATITGGKSSGLEIHLADFACLPLMPVDPELRQSLGLDAALELKQTFVDRVSDVREGDVLVVDGTEYQVRSVAEWPWRKNEIVLALVLEERK